MGSLFFSNSSSSSNASYSSSRRFTEVNSSVCISFRSTLTAFGTDYTTAPQTTQRSHKEVCRPPNEPSGSAGDIYSSSFGPYFILSLLNTSEQACNSKVVCEVATVRCIMLLKLATAIPALHQLVKAESSRKLEGLLLFWKKILIHLSKIVLPERLLKKVGREWETICTRKAYRRMFTKRFSRRTAFVTIN